MEQQRQDPDALVELHCRLADSYAGVAQLRVAWLDSMARLHMDGDDYPEAAMCNIHIAAIIAECLKREAQQHRGSGEENGLEGEKQWRDCDAIQRGSASLVPLSPNVADENPSSGDGGSLQEDHFTEEMFVERIQACAVLLTQAECYELVPIVYKLLVPIYEKKKNYERLSDVYRALHNVYARLITKTRTRLQDSYFRIALFGLGNFDDEEWKEYVYKEPQLTGLSEVSQRFERLYSNKFGADNVRIIQDSNPVDIQLLDPKVAYVQITFVTPLTQNTDGVQLVEPGSRGDVRHFSFETPYTQDGRKHGSVEEQCKRKTILTTSKSFPYICKRIPVLSKHVVDLGPVAVAVDEMQRKLQELRDLCLEPRVNMIQLQLKLQGSICVQVNAGPMTYARAFLQKANASKYPALEVELLGVLFRQFVDTCGEALEINKRLVKEDQREYHADLTEKYKQMVQELSEISDTMAPAVSNATDNRNSLHLYFNATEQASGNGAAFGAL
uniref:DOCKER domain-containing protein n=1 Tax=Eptatretus burgeri TaxID=7764 RepID=A0A8C4QPL1_EPTBU